MHTYILLYLHEYLFKRDSDYLCNSSLSGCVQTFVSVWFHKNFSDFLKLKLGEVSCEITAAKNSQFSLKFVGFHCCVAWKLISIDSFNIVASQKTPFIKNTIVAPQFTHVKWKVSIHCYSYCVLSNLGHSNNLTVARNIVISKNERGIFDEY